MNQPVTAVKKSFTCSKCLSVFGNKKNYKKHIRKQPPKCREVEASIKTKVDIECEERLNIIQENNKKIVDALVHAPTGVKPRQRVLDNMIAEEKKIQNFERVVMCTEIPEQTLRETVELMADGDVILFRRMFIDHIKPDQRCIRVKDPAREKYEIFDGKSWVLTNLTCIVEHLAQQLHAKYKFLIFEKSRKVDEIDRMYHEKTQLNRNMKEINKLCAEYANITEHVTKLGVCDPDFLNEIKRGIRGYLLNPPDASSEAKPVDTEPFKYNEDYQEPEEPPTPEYGSDDEEDQPKAPYSDEIMDQIILPSLFKILGIKYNVNNDF